MRTVAFLLFALLLPLAAPAAECDTPFLWRGYNAGRVVHLGPGNG